MRMQSDEALEANRMAMEADAASAPRGRYKYVYSDQVIDDNPSYTSSFRMASPAAPDHFLRVFGQPGRARLGDFRDFTASMRQALMMINGSSPMRHPALECSSHCINCSKAKVGTLMRLSREFTWRPTLGSQLNRKSRRALRFLRKRLPLWMAWQTFAGQCSTAMNSSSFPNSI